MRILYFIHWVYPHIGGMETLSMNSVPLFKKRGHEIVIVASTSHLASAPQDEYQGIPIYRLPMTNALQKRDIKTFLHVRKELVKLYTEFKPQLIHFHFGGLPVGIFLLDSLKVREWNIPLLTTLHTDISWMRSGADTFLEKIVQRSIWIVAISDFVKNNAIKTIPGIKGKISRIYNGVPEPNITIKEISFSPPKILCMGRMVKEKGFDIMIKAFKIIRQQYPQVQLILAGDGPEKKELELLATSFGIKEYVDFTGWVSPDQVPELINQSTIVVVPSRWEEPFGLVAVEAALLGRPVIAANVGGLKEIIKNESTGLLFKKEDAYDLAKKASFLLSQPTMARRFGCTARKNAHKNFLIKNYIDQYHEIYTTMARTENRRECRY